MAVRSKWVESFNNAVEGLIFVFKSQRSMKVHFIFCLLILIGSLFLHISFSDFLFLAFAMTFVLVAEMFNTAFELVMDMMSESYHPLIRVAKDASAGAVLIATLNAVIVGYLVVAKYLSQPIFYGLNRVLESPWHITLVAILTVLILSIGIKVFLGRGTPFYGGMPSAHSAIAFSIWAIVTILSRDPLVMTLTLIVALMIAQGRVASGIHRFREVLMGAILGVLVSLLVFQLVRHV
ncbi:MAG: diacylglycerol kinase [Chlamydiae bacterium]|nr:diacylglycerol kinase [Chlamydiota bacterium]MBI3277362.1 diacylglycerol kinase [Chlamydiota bacterium]